MIGLMAVAVVAQPFWAPADLPTVRARFLEGDLVALRRAQAVLRDTGDPPRLDLGAWGLLDDLSRLIRCQPLAPVPPEETAPWAQARALVRLERVRLTRLIQDGQPTGTALSDLLRTPGPYRWRSADLGWDAVRWPAEVERWPDEVAAPPPLARACAGAVRRASQRRDHDLQAIRARRHRQRRAVADLLASIDHQRWPATAARLAYGYLRAAAAVGPGFSVPETWLARLDATLARGPPAVRTAGRFALVALAERAGSATVTPASILGRILDDPDRTAAEDSRARVRLAAALEPDWARVRGLTETDARIRPLDEPAWTNARARALYALDDVAALMRLGRAFVRDRARLQRLDEEPFDAQTYELLIRLALRLPPPRALAWLAEIGPANPGRARDALADLGLRALTAGRLDLAAGLFDQLRLDAIGDFDERGPRARAEEAQWVGLRARVALERGDFGAFAGLVDEIIALARRDEGIPLARFAAHRSLATLVQDSIGRLADEVKTNPARRRFASVLLEASAVLGRTPSRYQRIFERYRGPLRTVAGGRRSPPPAATGARSRPPVRQLGEVRLPRLPPRLPVPDHPTRTPAISSYLVYQRADGRWAEGAPWAAGADAR